MAASPTVIHVPDWRAGNPYQSLLAEGIRATGWKVEFSSYPQARFPLSKLARSHPEAAALHVHWIAPYIDRLFWSQSSTRFWAKAMLLRFDVLWTRARGRRIIWTVHNSVSHETFDTQREVMMRKLLAASVSHLIFHSEAARDECSFLYGQQLARKAAIIPHGNYIGVYPPDPSRAAALSLQLGIDPSQTVVMFFGGLRRYKGVPSLVDAFRKTPDPNLRLIIAGRPFEEALRLELTRATAADSRIRLYLGQVPDADVDPLFSLTDIVAIPFERTLTSGSALLAMSLGKPLLLPAHARVLDIVGDRGAFFYDSGRPLEHVLNNLHCKDLQGMGKANLRSAQQLDWQTVGRRTAHVYSRQRGNLFRG